MPVAKKDRVAYGVLVGSLQNQGKSLSEAKKMTDKALKDHPGLGSKMAKKYGKGKGRKAPAAKSKKAPKPCKGKSKGSCKK